MRKIAAAVGMVITIFGLCSTLSSSQDRTSTHGARAAKRINIGSARLWMEYRADPVTADDTYRGKLLNVVSSVRWYLPGGKRVGLSTLHDGYYVYAYLQPGEVPKMDQITGNELLDFACIGGGIVEGSPILRNCTIRPHSAAKSN